MVDHTRRGNERLADVLARAPERLIGVACINPMTGAQALDEVQLRADQGFRAIRLYPAHHLYTVHDRFVLDPVLELAAERALPVYWTGCPAPGSILSQTPLDGLGDLLEAHPEVQWIASGYNYRDTTRLMLLLGAHPNLHLEISGYHGVEGVRRFTEMAGADRVLLGTGYGLQYAGLGVGKVKTANVSEETRTAVGAKNAQRLLRIAEE
jgi:predicted TIM-barrel fold metal-dependent hydrolase